MVIDKFQRISEFTCSLSLVFKVMIEPYYDNIAEKIQRTITSREILSMCPIKRYQSMILIPNKPIPSQEDDSRFI